MLFKKPLLPLLLLLAGCITDEGDEIRFRETYEPVYATEEVAYTLSVEAPFDIVNPSKIWIYNDLLMVNIQNEGVHVIDNSNPYQPEPLFFIRIPGNKDVALKDGYIYADNYADIVAFTLSESRELLIEKRIKGVMGNQEYPPLRGVNFVCVDPSKGVVVDWVLSDIKDPKCFR